ncbi:MULTISPECIES: MmgE/PrpD family protein [unclassified Acidovorax]|uniref:MmgE/PrpD family protein n=1 Tax=unclassified Acidovorax TaxID=2684926 RepID=UPI000C1935E8|nr:MULTISPECIES: MmgE/PrpD family protein [unclassified Acidovorax]PIF19392.1 2-methylcitrate dehydratase PrpD [Acidovorax sp. 59]PKW01580.1 2-methylcitrate dehydratase PrpD [Acidovorax sp. 30]
MNTATNSTLWQIAQQARSMSGAHIPESVRQQARLCILDTIGCILAGSRTEEAQLVLACEPESGDQTATVFGASYRRGLRAAMRINGYLGDVLELNDLIGGHASIGNVSAALALGESLETSGARLLEAVVRGIEVTTRVYESVYPSLRRYTEAGLVPVGIPASFGSAVAAAHLLSLDEEKTLHAMAIAGSLAGWCPAEVIFGHGGSVKPMLFGAQPADAGVTAAQYAKAGMTGPVNLLDSKVGYFATASTDGSFDAAAWNNRWALEQPRRKLHACCGYLHSAADALGKLRLRTGAALQDSRVEVRVPTYVADVVSKDRLPDSPNDARFHLQYCLALVACGADVILPEHSIALADQLQRPEVLAAMQRITVLPDSGLTHYHQCSIAVTDASGQTKVQPGTAPRGSPQEPLGDSEVVAKFHALADPVLGRPRAELFAQQALSLEAVDNVHTWIALLRT